MGLVQDANKKAREMGIEGTIYLSERKGKKLKILTGANEWIHFGDKYSKTFLEGASEEKKNSYRARASKIRNKEGKFTYKIPYTPNYLAYHILW